MRIGKDLDQDQDQDRVPVLHCPKALSCPLPNLVIAAAWALGEALSLHYPVSEDVPEESTCVRYVYYRYQSEACTVYPGRVYLHLKDVNSTNTSTTAYLPPGARPSTISYLQPLGVTTFYLSTLLAAAGVVPSKRSSIIHLICAFLKTGLLPRH
ncbi:hypothetical protein O3P69_016629 [Scylla paramamosain]|uniref:Uncharacterized protein n=1 Tax=Scylla paramamosain TaxID=85552 RepID=A0AAW0SYL7_SCYPA